MYWTDRGTKKIQRANLDGSQIEDLIVANLIEPYGIALNVPEKTMYIADAGTGKILRADLDGANVRDLIPVTGGPHPSFIELDLAARVMYWSDNRTNKIMRANLDGTIITEVISSGLAGPRGIALGR